MPEIRYREVYKDGKVIAREPYEVSDEELLRECLITRLAEIKTKGKANWTASDLRDAIEAILVLTGL